MEKFKEIIGDKLILSWEDGSSVEGTLKGVRIISDSDREQSFIIANLDVGGTSLDFDLNEVKSWFDLNLYQNNREKHLEERFNITTGMTESEKLLMVTENWKNYDKDQKEEISKLIAETKWEIFAELMGAYAIWKDESERLHKECMKLLDEKKVYIDEKYEKVNKELREANEKFDLYQSIKGVCSKFYSEGRV